MSRCTIAICTRDRPELLARCLAGLSADLGGSDAPVLLVDNSDHGSAAPVVSELTDRRAVQLIREPVAGLSRARNRAVEECRTPYLAFLDDDAVPVAGWTAALDAALERWQPVSSMTGRHRGDDEVDVTGQFQDQNVQRYGAILCDLFPAGIQPGASWLDIGCGHGELLVALGSWAVDVEVRGCEPNVAKIRSARSRALDVSWFDPADHAGEYHVVSLLKVFSHLPDPPQLLARWRHLVQPGGFLLVETSHSCHLPARHHHKPYYLPDYLSFAGRGIVTRILETLGFRVVTTRIYRHAVFPPVTPKNVARELGRLILRRPSRLASLFPRQPERDMFILAQKID